MQPSQAVKSRKTQVQVQMREIIEVACTRAPATAQPKGSVWKELLKGDTAAGAPVGCPPAGTWVHASTRVGA